MPKPVFDTVIVRFGGEIGIKAPFTRKQYERRLNINIKASLKGHAIPYSAFSRTPGRLYIKTNQARETAEKLSRVFGISSLSPASETSSNLDEILKTSGQFARSSFKLGDSFAVRCHRVGKHPYTSQDICGKIGEHILSALQELKLTVDLGHPKQTLQLEIRDEKAYFFADVIKGVGGLPLGTQPKLVCLLKGDPRSVAACWMTMKRGCPQVLVHVDESLTDTRRKTEGLKKTAQKLKEWSIGFPARLRIANYDCKQQKLLGKYAPELTSLVLKRLMLRIAQRVAEATNAQGIVTGDLFGKNAARRTHFFRIQDDAVKGLPVYRPLLGLDADEVASIFRTIGLEKTGAKKAEQSRTEAEVELGKIREIEHMLNSEEIIDDAVKSIQTIEL